MRTSSLVNVELIPVKVNPMKDKFDLFQTILQNIEENKQHVSDGDIVAVSSKFVSMSQGSLVELDKIKPSKQASEVAEKLSMDARLAELVLRESDFMFSGVPGFILAVKDGVIAPNAGIDRSNVQHGYAILHPREPFKVAEILRREFLSHVGKKVGIVITDSRLMPTRIGTIGIAIAAAGFEPVQDLRGTKDLFGNTLRVTLKATADSIATAANMIMGESNESIPIVLVRNLEVAMSDRALDWKDLAIPSEQCIYVRGLRDV
ncbi:MAG: coenzyme F420-0:L-glutamate ligase [Candidatus Nitrosomirales archaeon]|jgi:coenzyme F420-0:L-glutamate ligase